MKDLLATYAILPIVYFMYKAGVLAAEKGYRPIRWQLRAYATTLFGGIILPLSVCLISLMAGFKMQNGIALVLSLAALYLTGVLSAGFMLMPHLKDRKLLSDNKKFHREYNLKTAFLFPKVIPRGGFLWRAFIYWMFMFLLTKLFELTVPLLGHSPAVLILLVGFLATTCFMLLYFLSHICIPRIRDAGLSSDTFIMLFIPGLGQIAFLMMLATPTRATGRLSI